MARWLLAAAIALIAVGCGGSTETTAGGEPAEVETGEIAAPADAWAALEREAEPDADRLIIPEGPVPEKVLIRRLHPGQGPPIEEYDRYHADWITFDYESGKIEQDSRDSAPERFTYTPGTTVKAWWPGLQGMRIGERRELVVPADWAWGTNSRVYLVELTEIKRRSSPNRQ